MNEVWNFWDLVFWLFSPHGFYLYGQYVWLPFFSHSLNL
jgi:hypothetical protein